MVTKFESTLELLDKYTLKGDESVLEIGCGAGKNSARISERVLFGKVVGIDASQQMIDMAKKTFGRYKNLEFQHTTIADFSTNTKFDLIVSFSAFDRIGNPPKLLNKLSSMIKPNGRLLIQTGGGNSKIIEEVLESKKWNSLVPNKKTVHALTEANYGKIIAEADFPYFKVRTVQASKLFNNEKEFIESALNWLPFVTGLSGDAARDLAKDLAVNCKKHMPSPDPTGKIEWVEPVMIIEATK